MTTGDAPTSAAGAGSPRGGSPPALAAAAVATSLGVGFAIGFAPTRVFAAGLFLLLLGVAVLRWRAAGALYAFPVVLLLPNARLGLGDLTLSRLATACLILAAACEWRAVWRQLRQLPWWLGAAAATFVALQPLLLLNAQPGGSERVGQTVVKVALAASVAGLLRTRERVRGLVWACAMWAALLAVGALALVLVYRDPTVLRYALERTASSSLLRSSVYIQAEELALLALVLIWPVGALARSTADRRVRIALWSVVAGLTATIVLSGTRSAQLTLVVLALGYALGFAGSRRRAAALVTAVVVLIAGVTLAVPYQRARLFDGARHLASGDDTRLQLARVSIESAGRHPLLGTGAGSFESVVRSQASTFPLAYQQAEARRGLAAHNDLELVLVESGAFGAAAWIALLVAIAVTAMRTTAAAGLESLVRLRWIWLVSAFLASQAVVVRFQNGVWLMAGLSLSLACLARRARSAAS